MLKSKSILFICQEFNKSTNACSVCLKNVSEHFIQIGYKVYVISLVEFRNYYKYSPNYEVYEIKRSLFSRYRLSYLRRPNFWRKLRMILFYLLRLPLSILYYPNDSLLLQKKIIKLASTIIEEKKPSYVVALYTPFDCIAANLSLKQKYADSSIKFINYHLDPLVIPNNKLAITNKFKYRKAINYVDKEIALMDKVLYPPSVEGLIKSGNVEYVKFPLYIPSSLINNGCKKYFSKDEINLTYIGTLDQVNRNICFFISILEKLRKQIPIKLHIWGFIQDIYSKNIIEKSDVVEYHGVIDSYEVPHILAQSDFNVNVSNKISYNAVPSKIFQLFAAARPIINVVNNPNDYSLKYFEEYKYFYRINEYLNKKDEEQLLNYILSYHNSNIIMDKDLFNDCTPEYIANKIIH